jgi:hypothetical protein
MTLQRCAVSVKDKPIGDAISRLKGGHVTVRSVRHVRCISSQIQITAPLIHKEREITMSAKVQPMPDLKQRMAAATAASAPSLVPEYLNPPPPKEEEMIHTLQELVTDKKDLLALKRLINEDIALKEVEANAKKQRKPLISKMKNLLGKYSVGKALLDDIRVNYFTTSRSSIKADLLLANGVSPAVIQKCTVTSDVYTLKLSRGKDEEGEE